MKTFAVVLAMFLSATTSLGCHTMRFELSPAPYERVVYERKSFFFWGLAPTKRVDAADRCPGGVAAIRERTTFTDGLLGALTLGIWQPRSSWYYCRQVRDEATR